MKEIQVESQNENMHQALGFKFKSDVHDTPAMREKIFLLYKDLSSHLKNVGLKGKYQDTFGLEKNMIATNSVQRLSPHSSQSPHRRMPVEKRKGTAYFNKDVKKKLNFDPFSPKRKPKRNFQKTH
mmetsp:Transcript_33649/g.51917  ORF Transcript_33649/g.51917 Transcript_33649/m.51917 type:complete len:125 (+) Transcript_33649:1708-2082(+)